MRNRNNRYTALEPCTCLALKAILWQTRPYVSTLVYMVPCRRWNMNVIIGQYAFVLRHNDVLLFLDPAILKISSISPHNLLSNDWIFWLDSQHGDLNYMSDILKHLFQTYSFHHHGPLHKLSTQSIPNFFSNGWIPNWTVSMVIWIPSIMYLCTPYKPISHIIAP